MDIKAGSKSDWERFCEASPHATFFCTPQWAAALKQAGLASKTVTYLVRFSSGKEAFLVGMEVPSFRGGLYGFYSMPLGCYGGPLTLPGISLDASEWNELVRRFSKGLRRTASVFELPPCLQLPSFEWEIPVKTEGKPIQMLELKSDFKSLFQDQFSSRNRTCIRKAKRDGLTVVDATSEEDCEAFIRMYEENSASWHHRLPRRMLLYLTRQAVKSNNGSGIRFRLTKIKDRIVAGGIFLYHKDKASPFMTAYDKSQRMTTATNILYNDEIEFACANGYRSFCFGSSLGIKSVEKFKASFGAIQMIRYRITARSFLWRKCSSVRARYRTWKEKS